MMGIGWVISLVFGRVVVKGKAIFLCGYNPVWLSLG
jgi:hypothetical protein